jgi:CRP-like cAMP-binding protein
VHVLVIRDTDFRAMLLRTPQIALKVMEAVAERLPPGAT